LFQDFFLVKINELDGSNSNLEPIAEATLRHIKANLTLDKMIKISSMHNISVIILDIKRIIEIHHIYI